MSIIDGTHLKFKVSGAATADCENEVYALSGSTINIPGASTSGDCVHDALEQNGAKLDSSTYDSSADTIKVKVTKIIAVTITLTKAGEVEADFMMDNAPRRHESYQALFREFIQRYEKKYDMASFFQRYNIFRNNVEMIRAHNHGLKNESYSLGLNEFADMTHAEFKTQFLGLKPVQNSYLRSRNVVKLEGDAPASIDWVIFIENA